MNNIGLVLAGGGGKGGYFIGVWKALIKLKFDTEVCALSGSSVGSLNSILFANGSFDFAFKLWSNIKSNDILTVSPTQLFEFLTHLNIPNPILSKTAPSLLNTSSSGIFSRKGLLKLINNKIDFNKISTFSSPLYSCVYNVDTLSADYLKINNKSESEIKSILLATSALPVLFDKEKINNHYYYDGGLIDNIPIKPLYDEGIRNFIVVHLDRSTIINKSNFPSSNIVEIIPNKHQGDLINGVLDFSKHGFKKRFNQGYNDALEVLTPICNLNLIQNQIYNSLNTYVTDNKTYL